MALDGAFLTCLRRELTASLPDARIDKIHQPGREELVLVMRTSAGTRRLYLSAQQAAPRIHLTADQPENPAQPPMFCMLLRKRLTGGRLLDIRQEGQERALSLSFDCLDELGDHVCLPLIVESMGRNSNIILVGGDGRIIDAIRRVDPDGTARPVLPSFPYEKPPAPAGLPDTLRRTAQAVTEDVCTCDRALSKALLNEELGLSPLVCRELAFRTAGADDVPAASLDEAARARLTAQIARVQDIVRTGDGAVPYLLLRPDGTALEFSFLPIAQYGLSARGQELPSFSALLDAFYSRRSAAERMRARARPVPPDRHDGGAPAPQAEEPARGSGRDRRPRPAAPVRRPDLCRDGADPPRRGQRRADRHLCRGRGDRRRAARSGAVALRQRPALL